MNRKITFVLFALFGALSASASLIQVSVTGTADTTEMGYTQGESYTFNWVVNDGYTGAVNDEFNATTNLWYVHRTIDPVLWASVSGDGLTGTYSRPADEFDAPENYLRIDDAGLRCWAANSFPTATSMGLFANEVEIQDIFAYDLEILGIDYGDMSFINPATYLEAYIGNYNSPGGGVYLGDETGNTMTFSATSITISIVPEPTTFLLFFIGGIGAWLLRRNHIKGEQE